MIQPIEPVSIGGFATLAVTIVSVAVSTATVGPGSGAYPAGVLPSGVLMVMNSPDSANNLYVAPLGGTVTSANGIPITPGQYMQFNVGFGTTSPTVISGGTATCVVAW